ncbi:hypothetical protein [Streptomyces sp. NBC_00063]|uniref:hypothetical protein n=1 Tax=Streptomyces sp. NBC_00063 TaxID=2975638 RepID=UPI003D757AA5
MLRRITQGRAAAVGVTLAAMTAFGVGTADAAGAQTGDGCQSGYLCLTVNDPSSPEMVPEGWSYTFDPALYAASIENLTSVTYCVHLESDLGIPLEVKPGEMEIPPRAVSSVEPAWNGVNCPL